MIESQRRLLDQLGVGRLFAVVGASMGGMQALQWAVSEPERMERVVAMTAMARTTRWSQLMNELSRRALFADPECRLPRPRADAMRLWVPLTQLAMTRTPEALQGFATQDALLQWLEHAAAEWLDTGPDPFDWCHQTWAYDAHDVGTTPGCGGDTAAALARIQAEVLVLAPTQDLYNPAFAASEIVAAIRRSRLVALPGNAGHRSASGAEMETTAALSAAIEEFLDK